MTLYFITGNKNKFDEARRIIPELEQKSIELDEIQSTDAEEVVKHKLNEAIKHFKKGDKIVIEDTSLYFECLNGLPGPLIKWFLEKIGNDGLWKICDRLGNCNADARTLVGFYDGKEMKFFSGIVKGRIVKPMKKTCFGWDSIFVPDGFDKAFVDMEREEKNKISMRGIAFRKLRDYSAKNSS